MIFGINNQNKNRLKTYLMAKQQLTCQEKSTREQEWHHLSDWRERAEKINKNQDGEGGGEPMVQDHEAIAISARTRRWRRSCEKADVRECLTMMDHLGCVLVMDGRRN